MRRAWPLVLLGLAAPAAAASLTIVKSSTVLSDPVNAALNPRAIPGAVIDYSVLVTNPLANLLTPVRKVVLVDTIPTALKLRIVDYGATGSGPVEFTDGGLLNLGLINGGLGYGYAGLGDTGDGLEFFDGTSWSYVPHDDGAGFDPAVRAIRVTMTGTQIAGGSFRLRYRVQIR